MKLRLVATPEELQERGGALLERLSAELEPHAPDLASALAKAIPGVVVPAGELVHPALQEMHADTHARYQQMLKQMLDEIGDVLDAHVKE